MPLRFDPATPLERTPPFVRWTLPYACPLREFSDYLDPEASERLLRGVRTYSDAVVEHRVCRGIGIERATSAALPMQGFDVAAVLEPLGGQAHIESQCSDCVANALRRAEATALAGCVGLLIPPPDFVEPANPQWFALWIEEQLTREQLIAQRAVFLQLTQQRDDIEGLADYLLAVDAALEHHLPLVVRSYPGGQCEGRRWIVDSHCNRCKASWPEQRRQQCRVCQQLGGRQASRTRKRLGTRPYRPLREFLTTEQIEQLSRK